MLTHTYHGPGYRLLGDQLDPTPELILGAFKVIRENGLIYLDNGEGDEAHGRWLIPSEKHLHREHPV